MSSLPIGIKTLPHTIHLGQKTYACLLTNISIILQVHVGKNQTSLIFTGRIEWCQTNLSMIVRIALLGVCEHTPLAYCINLVSPIARTVSKDNCNIIIFSILCICILFTCTIAPGHEKKNGGDDLREHRKISKILHQYVSCLNVLEQDHQR